MFLYWFTQERTISIHAPSRERPWGRIIPIGDTDFNPRSLTGATKGLAPERLSPEFQSTLPHGSDLLHVGHGERFWISIHAPSRERQAGLVFKTEREANFNPRSLTGATMSVAVNLLTAIISIHAPSRERHCGNMVEPIVVLISIHAPSRERQPRI